MDLLYICDLIGTFAFAVYGAYTGFQKKFDIYGVTVCALLPALGGGTIRELILNKTPAYFHDYNYLYVVFFAIIFCTFVFKHFHRIHKQMLVLDAVGLATFAFIGAARAAELHMGPVAIIMFAPLTAVGGGMLKDIVANDVPGSFKGEIYATPTIILGVFYVIFQTEMNNPVYAFILIAATFFTRALAIQYQIRARNWKDVHALFSKTPFVLFKKPHYARKIFFYQKKHK